MKSFGELELDKFCKENNIPIDRVRLIRRNVELKEKLNVAIKSIRHITESVHIALEHGGEYDTCTKGTCTNARLLQEKLRS